MRLRRVEVEASEKTRRTERATQHSFAVVTIQHNIEHVGWFPPRTQVANTLSDKTGWCSRRSSKFRKR